MRKPTKREQSILDLLMKSGPLQSSAIHENFIKSGEEISLVTIKRALSGMESLGMLSIFGSGRSTTYGMRVQGRLITNIDAKKYCADDPDRRYGNAGYNFDVFGELTFDIFFPEEIAALEKATAEYQTRVKDMSPILRNKELERFVIELSWKSSKIEGNTYTLLDTERLILRKEEAFGHDKKEACMILNHKDAFKFIREHSSPFKALTRAGMEETHKILIKDLGVVSGWRTAGVGVVGSKYRPLDNRYKIMEAVDSLIGIVGRTRDAYAKALIALLGISYIQPFEDGNKRTARLVANAILLAYGCAPLSYRSVDENEYREALLVFYELNSAVPFKKIFMEQYDFAAKNYLI
ncbi:cell filamentation protein Fic [bacterium]|nr:MAG: cell filamentation protein Fic [bacterium]